jgi:hypothetical protein
MRQFRHTVLAEAFFRPDFRPSEAPNVFASQPLQRSISSETFDEMRPEITTSNEQTLPQEQKHESSDMYSCSGAESRILESRWKASFWNDVCTVSMVYLEPRVRQTQMLAGKNDGIWRAATTAGLSSGKLWYDRENLQRS